MGGGRQFNDDFKRGAVSFALTSNWDSTLKRLRQNSERIEELRVLGLEENVIMNSRSEFDFWLFAIENPNICVREIVLVENGNLRVSWRNSTDSFMGLQFLGEGEVQFVIFKRRNGSQFRAEVSGEDHFTGILKQIELFDLHSLVSR